MVFLLACVTVSTARASVPPKDLLVSIQDDFHGARKWFQMVADLTFDRQSDGSFSPRYESLHSRFVLMHDPAGQSIGVQMPSTTDGQLNVWINGTPNVSVRTTELGIASVPAKVLRGLVIYRRAVAGGDLLYKLTPTHVDEYLYFRDPPQSLTRRFNVETGSDVARLQEVPGYVEVIDRHGTARLRLSAPLARAANGARRRGTVRLEGKTIVEEIELAGLTPPVLVDPDWTTTGTMTQAHWGDMSWLRPDGEVMAVGGCTLSACPASFTQAACSQVIASTDVWNESSGTWTAGPSMATGRYLYAGIVLSNDDLLVAGGCITSGCTTMTSLAERYVAASGRWISVGSLSTERANASGVLLSNGDAIIAGGCTPTACTTNVDRFVSGANSFSPSTPLPAPRGFAASTLLADGRVLMTGGCADAACRTILDDAIVFDPASSVWSPAGTLLLARAAHTATLMKNGDVLIAGGCSDAACANTLNTVEIWSPKGGGALTAGPSMLATRHNHTSTLLANGDVLVAGGISAAGATTPMAEVYLPNAGYWYDTTGMIMDRAYHTAVLLGSGKVLVAGGCNPATCIPFAEVYSPASLPVDVDGGKPPPPPDAGTGNVDAGPPPVFTANSPHPPLYRDDVTTCATTTAEDLVCPAPYFGLEDAEFQPNARTLQQNGDEIFDVATGLSWQAGDSGTATYDELSAAAYCSSLATAATPAGEWRLPSVVELFTIDDAAVDNPSTNPLFLGTQTTNYWTSTLVSGNPQLAWTVKFDYGEVIPLLVGTSLPVRCVHGPPLMNATGKLRLAGPFVTTTSTVLDSTTGLEWQRQDDGTKRTWQGALNYCAALSLAGEAGWHLPNIQELFGLIEFDTGSVYATSIDPAFQNAKADLYWSGTQNEGTTPSLPGVTDLGWSVNFNLGVIDGVTVTGVAYARCVRHLWVLDGGTPGMDGGSDGGATDGGGPVDAGRSEAGTLDGGAPADAGTADAGQPGTDGESGEATAKPGCGCSGSPASSLLILIMAVVSRRRSRRGSI